MLQFLGHVPPSVGLLVVALIIIVPLALYYISREKRQFEDRNHDN